MAKPMTARQALYNWLDGVMADKSIFTRNFDNKIAKDIGLTGSTMNNFIRIIRDASRELIGKDLSSGRISDILIEKKNGIWKIVVFKSPK